MRMDAQTHSFTVFRGEADPAHEAKWRKFLGRCDFPTHYIAPEFFREPSLRRLRPFAILAFSRDDIVAVLTGYHEDGVLRSGLSVRPQIAFCRNADTASATHALMQGLTAEAKSSDLIDVCTWSRNELLARHHFHERQEQGVVMLDLSRGPQALFRDFSENKRTNIKKAIKKGVVVAPAQTTDEISEYYEVYRDWATRKSLPVVDAEEFHETFALAGNRRLFLAHYAGKILAGVVVRFQTNGLVEYSANSSREEALHLRPNDLLHWRVIEWACAEGFPKYSLGGTHLFLRKFGGEIYPTYRYRLDRTFLRAHLLRYLAEDALEAAKRLAPERMVAFARTLRDKVWPGNQLGQ
jgi:hypothetical protein